MISSAPGFGPRNRGRIRPTASRPALQGLSCGDHKHADETTAITDDHRVLDQVTLLDRFFDRDGSNVLSTGSDDELFLAADDHQMPVLVDHAEISGSQPAINDCLGGGFGHVPVAPHDVRAAREHFAVTSDLQLDPR